MSPTCRMEVIIWNGHSLDSSPHWQSYWSLITPLKQYKRSVIYAYYFRSRRHACSTFHGRLCPRRLCILSFQRCPEPSQNKETLMRSLSIYRWFLSLTKHLSHNLEKTVFSEVGGLGDRAEWIDPPNGGVDTLSQALSPRISLSMRFSNPSAMFTLCFYFKPQLHSHLWTSVLCQFQCAICFLLYSLTPHPVLQQR